MCKTSRRRCELHGTVYKCAIETIKTSSLFPSCLFIAVVFTLISRLSIWFHLSVWRQSDGLIIALSCNYLFFLSFPLAFSDSLHSMVYIHFGVPPLRVRLCRCWRRGRHTYTKMPGLQRGEWKDVKGPLSRKKKKKKKYRKRNRICKLALLHNKNELGFFAFVCFCDQDRSYRSTEISLITALSLFCLSLSLSLSFAPGFMAPLLTAAVHSGKARDRKAFFLDMRPTGAVTEISKRISGEKNKVICVEELQMVLYDGVEEIWLRRRSVSHTDVFMLLTPCDVLFSIEEKNVQNNLLKADLWGVIKFILLFYESATKLK